MDDFTDQLVDSPEDVTITDFVDELVVGLMNTRIYWNAHPRVLAPIARLRKMLPVLREAMEGEEFDLHIAGEHIVYDRKPLIGAGVSATRFIEALRDRSCGGVRFKGEISEAAYQALFEVLVDRSKKGSNHTSINAQLIAAKCLAVELLEPSNQTEVDAEKSLSLRVLQGLNRALQDATVSLCHGGGIPFEQSQECIERTVRTLRSGNSAFMMSAVRYDQFDAFASTDSIRVAVLAAEFAKTLTKDDELLNRIGVAALLHDIGKVRVPFEILHSEVPLDAEQKKILAMHTEWGAEILMDHDACDPMIYGVAFGHHLDVNGVGYPKSELDLEVAFVTRLIKICDVYEALTAIRPNHPPISPTRAYRIMMSRGHAFDQTMLKQFINAIGVYPAGVRVGLSTGEQGTVLEQSTELFRPVIEIDRNAAGEEIPGEQRTHIDLSEVRQDGDAHADTEIQELMLSAEIAHC